MMCKTQYFCVRIQPLAYCEICRNKPMVHSGITIACTSYTCFRNACSLIGILPKACDVHTVFKQS